MRKTVVISILSLNNCGLLKQCLESIFKNTVFPYRVCVVNQGSEEKTREYLESLGGAVDAIHTPKNLGFVVGNNLVIERYPEHDIVLLNNDTIVKPGWLSALVECAYSDPAIGIVGAKLLYPDGRLQEAGSEIFQNGSGRNIGKYDDPQRYIYNIRRDVDYCSGACLFLKRSMLDQIGYLDPIFSPAYWEDTDICFRARKHGWRVVYEPKVEVIHIEGATSGLPGQKTLSSELQARNKPKFMARWGEELKKHRANVFEIRSDSGKEKILVILPFLPMYDRAAGEKRWFYALQILKKYFDIVFLARNGQGQLKYINELEKMGITVFHTDQTRLALLGYDIKGPLWIDFPLLLNSNDFKAIIVGFYHVAHQYWRDIRKYSPNSVFIIDSYDLAFLREYRRAKLNGDPQAIWKALEVKRIELSMYKRADMVLTVTEEERKKLLDEEPNLKVGIATDVHAVGEFRRDSEGKNLIFVGNFNHPPNEDAVLYFVDQIFPLIKKEISDVKFYVVGNNPTKVIKELTGDDIIVTGYVPDVIPYLLESRVFVCPLRYGAGLKGKIGEALVTGTPIVTTWVGAEGVGLVSGVNAMIADSPQDFANAVVEIYRDKDLWQKISEEGKRHGERMYSFGAAERYWLQTIEFIRKGRTNSSKVDDGDVVLKGFRRNKISPEVEPNVSIIIPVYNNLSDLRSCWTSIKKNTSIPYRLIIVDNGSTEDVAYEADQNRIEVIRNPTNMGFAYACNQGIREANGDYVVVLNSDTIVTPGWLERLIWHMESDPMVGIVGPSTNFAGSLQQIKTNYRTERELYDFSEELYRMNSRRSLEVEKIVGVCMLMRRRMLEEVGLFDTRFGLGNYEDDDICLRARIGGYKILWAQDVFVHHSGSKTFRILNVNYNELLEENRKKFNQKWGLLLKGSPKSQECVTLPNQRTPLLILPFSTQKKLGVENLGDIERHLEIIDLTHDLSSQGKALSDAIIDVSKHTPSPYLLFLRDGSVLTPDWWAPLIQVLSDKSIGCSLSGTNQGIGEQFVRQSYRALGKPLLRFAKRNALEMKRQVVDLLIGLPAAMAVRKDVILDIGLSQEFQTSGILIDLQRRIKDAGLKVLCVKESFVHCHEGLSGEEDAVVTLVEAIKMLEQGNLDSAISFAEKAIGLKPDYREAIYQLGIMLSLADRLDQALEKFESLLKSNPRDSRVLNNLGCIWFRRNEVEKAEKALKEAIVCNRANWEAKKNLADLYIQTGKPHQAGEIYSQILEHHKECPEAMLALAEIFISLGDCSTAEMVLRIVLKNCPGNKEARRVLEEIKGFGDQSLVENQEITLC